MSRARREYGVDAMKLLASHSPKPVFDTKKNQLKFNPSPHLSEADRRAARNQIRKWNSGQGAVPRIALLFDALVNAKDPDDYERWGSKKKGVAEKKKNSIESVFKYDLKKNPLISNVNNEWGCVNNFVAACVHAWSNHLPLVIKPIHLWHIILQGVATHVNENSEELRSKWVPHKSGKVTLEVVRDDFVLGSPENDWQGVVREWNEKMSEKMVKDTYAILDPNGFKNASLVEKVAVGVTCMDICKKYFRFLCSTCCGFSEIILDGDRDDWVSLQSKMNRVLSEKCKEPFGKEWMAVLNPILAEFVNAYDGKIDCIFWNSMIKRGSVGGSGGYAYFSGWINGFFPFTKSRGDAVKNEFCFDYPWDGKKRAYYADVEKGLSYAGNSVAGWMGGTGPTGMKMTAYPNGMSAVPVEWNYYGRSLPMQFFSGFVGYTHDKSLNGAVTPVVGWCLAHTKDPTIVEGIMNDKREAERKEKE